MGFHDGDFTSPLFKDVPLKMREWTEKDVSLAIFSSGSVPAQKLLLNYVEPEEGSDAKSQDLRPLISDYFDTVNAGPKSEPESYITITQAMKVRPADVYFFTDVVKGMSIACRSDSLSQPDNISPRGGGCEACRRRKLYPQTPW